MMKCEKIEEIIIKKVKLPDDSQELGTALRLYAFELLSERCGIYDDIEKIKEMVESTSHVLEKIYQEYEESDLSMIKSADGVIYNDSIYKLSVFISVMCAGSRVYENLDPVFSRDIMHAALDAAHFLISRQFKEADEEENESSERDSIVRMSSRDADLTDKTVAALIWAFAELLKTDKDIRNAYDHSLMAGMPQKMSRQKRYKLRLSEMSKRMSSDNSDLTQNVVLLLAAEVVLLDTEDTFSDEVKKPLYDYLYKASEDTDDELTLLMAYFSLLAELEIDEKLSAGGSQLIKVVEYNVIGGNKKRMTQEERAAIEAHIQRLESKLS